MHSAEPPIFGTESHCNGQALSLESIFLFDFYDSS
jgi:hypothetical protein